jgi:predicted nucleic acid-binding protein
VIRAIVLDSGPLGRLAHPRPNREIAEWYERSLRKGAVFVITEIADYELRRELLRANLRESVALLDAMEEALVYVPVTTAILRRAAELWAQTRNQGGPTADDKALDADVILAAQTELIMSEYDEVVIATENVGHLTRLAPAKEWRDI